MTEDNNHQKAKRKSQVVLREMELDDLPTVFHLGERLFTASKAPNLYRTWDEYDLVEMYQSDPELCLVAELENRVVGFALGTTIEKSRSAWKYGHLVWLGVQPELQRKGIAARIFNIIRDRMAAEGVRIMIVDTEADNLSALHFFRRMGFGKPEEHIYLSLNMTLSGKEKKTRSEQDRNHG